jgi:hypothetical protein
LRIVKGVPAASVLGLAATVIALVAVIVQSMFTGDTTSRTVGAAVAGVAASVIVIAWEKFGPLFTWASGRDMNRRHGMVLLVLAVVFVPVALTHARWLPGVLNDCYTSPLAGGMTSVVTTPDGQCYGLLDTAAGGLLTPEAFGRNPATVDLERRILERNRPLRDGDLTVVWLGALSCPPSPSDSAKCADGRDYPAERDQLRGLLLAQDQIAARTGHRLHVVIGDAGPDVAHIDNVAKLVVAHREAFGGRLVVIGGGDSRDATQHAINRLLDHGIPFIAPNLLADLGYPGRPFVQRPGYLQLPPPNLAYAVDTVTRIKDRHPGGFRLDVFQVPNPSDQYTTSLVNDILATVPRVGGRRAAARHLTGLDRIDTSICRGNRASAPTVLFFADRWGRFGDFIRRVNDVCGYDRPEWVIADSSVSRFMASNSLRATSNATWPLDYYVGGLGCAELRSPPGGDLTADLVNRTLRPAGRTFTCPSGASRPGASAGPSDRDPGVYCTLDAAESVSQPCAPNDLGTFVAQAWDAVMLADALLPPRKHGDVPGDPDSRAGYLRGLRLPTRPLTQGDAQVCDGTLVTTTIPVRMWHVEQIDDPTSTPTKVAPAPGIAEYHRFDRSRAADTASCADGR